MNFVLNSNWPAYNIRLYASWAFSNGPSALEFQINFSNLALANRVFSGQASSRIKDYPNCAKPGTLCARQFNPVYMFGRLMQIFIDCSDLFLVNERNLILSGVSERCLCGSFMLILRRALDNSEFANYYSDIEYNRNFNGLVKTIIDDNMEVVNITCDLIIHSRGEIPKQDNLIAIEMKRDNHPEAEKEKDFEKKYGSVIGFIKALQMEIISSSNLLFSPPRRTYQRISSYIVK